jgi:HSP20 family protein
MARKNIAEFEWIQREMNKFLEYLRSTHRTFAGFSTTLWKPNINICETETHYMVEVEIPGVDPDKIRVNVRNDILTIEGDRMPDSSMSGARYLHLEIASGPFKREIRLPTSIDPAAVQAESKDGMLRILIQKAPRETGVREIKIQSKEEE